MKKVCPYCGKVIESLYESQLEYNYERHVEACKKKKKFNTNEKEVKNE